MTRFTDRVTRDLHQIADRSTPSSTAWDSIRTRIDEQTDQPPTMEVIMLSPDRNDSPKRGWMLAAAAVAALALVGGLVLATTNSDDDNVPADTPIATLPAEPAPDADSNREGAVEPDTEIEVLPELDADAEVPAEPEPEVGPVTVTLTGTYSDGETVDVPSPGATSGSTGTTTFTGEFSGVAPWTTLSWTAQDGIVRGIGSFEFTGSVEGLGSGTLRFVDRWQVVDGVWSSTATITGGTNSLGGATGTGEFNSDPATAGEGSTGTYTWTITVPPASSLISVTATGTAFDPDFAAEQSGVEGQLSYSAGTVLEGDMSGLSPHTGTAWVIDDTTTVGSGDFVFTGDIAGLGSGTMTYTDVWVFADGATTYQAYITGGTGDFDGITGTGVFLDEGDVDPYEFVLTVPAGQ